VVLILQLLDQRDRRVRKERQEVRDHKVRLEYRVLPESRVQLVLLDLRERKELLAFKERRAQMG
jgi:hypothetical protein